MEEQAEQSQTSGGAGFQQLARQLKHGANWIERRDAANALALMAREILLALRGASEQDDPDVKFAADQELETIQKDFTRTLEELEGAVIDKRRTLKLDQRSTTGDAVPVSGAAALSLLPGTDEIHSWLMEVGQDLRGHVSGSGGKYSIEVPLPEGRTQSIHLDTDEKDSDGNPMLLLYTFCGPASEKVMASAMQANARLSHAAFALGKREGEPYLMLVSRRRLAGYTGEDLGRDVRYLASKGDSAERQLTKDDLH